MAHLIHQRTYASVVAIPPDPELAGSSPRDGDEPRRLSERATSELNSGSSSSGIRKPLNRYGFRKRALPAVAVQKVAGTGAASSSVVATGSAQSPVRLTSVAENALGNPDAYAAMLKWKVTSDKNDWKGQTSQIPQSGKGQKFMKPHF